MKTHFLSIQSRGTVALLADLRRRLSSGRRLLPRWVELGRTCRGIWAVLLLVSLASCGPTQTLDDAIRQADRDIRIEHPVEVLRTHVDGETVVLQTATVGLSDLVVQIVFADSDSDPSRRLLLSTNEIVGGADPATISFANANGKFYVFGTIQDARIASLQLERVDGGSVIPVARPGFVIVREQTDGASPWKFLDSAGTVVLSGG